MAQHDVLFNIPARSLGKTDVEFEITRDGEFFGKLAISKGAVVWFPKNSKQGFKMGWKRFDEMMRENAGRRERRK